MPRRVTSGCLHQLAARGDTLGDRLSEHTINDHVSAPRYSWTQMLPLGVTADVLSTVQRVCDRALNLSVARARSSMHGPKAGIKMLHGKTVQYLPGGDGVVKDRALKFVAKKKRRSGKSGNSNWPKDKAERLAREQSKAERALLAAQRAAAAALREAISEMDDGCGAYAVRCPAEWMAITKVRHALADNMGRVRV